MILFESTNGKAPRTDLAGALLGGQAGDKGLYLPVELPRYPARLFARARDLAYPALAAELLWPYCDGVFARDALDAICESAYDYDVPIERVEGRRHVLRLDRGPTASFKDFAARFMGRALGRLVRDRGTELLILTATSGDTGSAVAHAFLGVPGIRVLVLFPRAEVSDRQRKQMTSLGGNVAAIAVDGKFDDCQALVKRAFADPALADLHLSSANSINIGRLLPQSVYYVYAASRLVDLAGGERVVFSVPSGNFGDLLGGVMAFRSGLPVARFAVATNANDEVPRFLASGRYEKIEPSRVCISNAMNVGHPSNLARLVALYGGKMDETGRLLAAPDMGALRRDFYAVSIDDAETRETIRRAHAEHGVLLEPHGAVGWAGLERLCAADPAAASLTAASLETAHPAKFPEEVRAITGVEPEVPPSLEGLDARAEMFGEMQVDYGAFRAHLEKEYRR
ncbi:MAG: threonine synthase [Proteobacteria bacterium]|jgi:threonine synthase|nr:threonine synthase [Pseudomonadota bacterium]